MLQINRLLRRKQERGAALVEFAVLAPFLILLLMGIIEFGYKFGQFNEIRHAVRETGRYAMVSNPDVFVSTSNGIGDNKDVWKKACDSFQLAKASFKLELAITDTYDGPPSLDNVNDTGTVTITANVSSLTGFPVISSFIPTQLKSEAEFRIERPTVWTPGTIKDFNDPCPPPS